VATAAALLPAVAAAQPAARPLPELIAACTACHGPDGNASNPQWPSIAGQPRIFLENQLVIIREGLRDVPTMKAVMGTMSDADIMAVARHYSALPKVPLPTTVRQEQRLRGAEISRRALCGTCHLADYTGQNQVPRLAGQNEPYLLHSLRQFRDHPGPGRDTIMAATLLGLSDRDLEDLAHYFAVSRP
jgi:cytochrome c553